MTLAPLRFARGMAAPASATAPPLARRGAACAGGWPFLAPPSSRHTSWSGSTAGLRVELARPAAAGLARLRLGQGPRRSRGPVPFGSGRRRTARVRSGGGPPAFLPRRRTCRKVPRPETGRPRHARFNSAFKKEQSPWALLTDFCYRNATRSCTNVSSPRLPLQQSP